MNLELEGRALVAAILIGVIVVACIWVVEYWIKRLGREADKSKKGD
jgi:hypothetical protein